MSAALLLTGLCAAQTPPSAVVRMDAGLDAILAPDAKLEMVAAEGFDGGEGPV